MPDPEFDLYLSLLSRFLRLKPAQRDEIADELRDDLEQRLEDFAAEGLSRDAAIRAALDELGDAAELAKHFTHLARIRRRRLIMRLTFGTVAALCAVVLFATAFWPAHPQAPAPNVADAASKADVAALAEAPSEKPRSARWVTPLKHFPASDLANALTAHFQGEPRISVIAEPVSNTLLLTFPEEMRRELETTLRVLDHAPMAMAVEVTIVEFAISSNAPDNAAVVSAPFESSNFEGPADEVRAKLQKLCETEKTRRFKRFRVNALNNQLTQCEDKKAHSGDPQGAMRPETTSDAGTTVQFMARVGEDHAVTMELVVRDWPGPSPVKTPNFKKVPTENIANLLTDNFLGTIYVPSDRAVVASSIEHQTANGPTQIIYIVSAEVIDARAGRPQAAQPVEGAPPVAAESGSE